MTYLGNLGRNRESLEEGGLFRTQASVLGWNDDRAWSDGSRTGWGTDFVLQQFVADFHEVTTGEHEANIATDIREQPAGIVVFKFGFNFLRHDS
jgi:hypothetical protein